MANVVVAGGGYAGLAAARSLATLLPQGHSIVLVDRDPFHELTVLLPAVLSGRVAPSGARLAYRDLLPARVRFLQAEVLSVDTGARRVEIAGGELNADWLIVALGRVPNLSVFPGSERSLPLRTANDALSLRARLESTVAEKGNAAVILLGAGYTSTEVAGEIVTWARQERAPVEVTIVAVEPRILPQGNERIARIATRMLTRAGIRLRLGEPPTLIDEGAMRVGMSAPLPYDILIWGGPGIANPVVTGVRSAGGRIAVDPYLQVQGAEGVFAVGDIAASYDFVHDRSVPASAQFASQEGALAGENVARLVAGHVLREYRPFELGEALDMGAVGAVAEVAGFIVRGAAARAAKRAALSRYLARVAGPASALSVL